MLKTLELHNFKSVRHDVMSFEPGLIAVRAPNEAGKSTRIHAILYALYGARALNLPLADVVTWGEPENTLKVRAVFEIEGRTYEFRRAKSGAEVYVDGNNEPYVTGQGEVTNFAASLLGADMATANKLMFANQGNLRGALDQGPKATAEMIEDLADFDLFETLLERMEKHLVLGSDSQVRERLERAEIALEGASVQEPDHTAALGEIASLQVSVKSQESLLKNTLEPQLRKAQDAVATAKADRSAYDKWVNERSRAVSWLTDVSRKLEKAKDEAGSGVDLEEIARLQGLLEDANSAQRQLDLWNRLQLLPKSEVEWEGGVDSLGFALSDAKDKVASLRESAAGLNERLIMLRSSIMETSDTCPTCGQSIKNHAEVLTRNEKIQREIRAAESKSDQIKTEMQELQADIKDMEALLVLNRDYDAYILDAAMHLHVDLGFVPPRLSWKGEKPEVLDREEIQQKLQALEAQKTRIEEAKASVSVLSEELQRAQEEVARVNSTALTEPENLDKLREVQAEADQKVSRCRQEISNLERQISEIKVQMQVADQAYKTALQRREDLELQVQQAQEDLQVLAFNNNLLKKIRAARPIVADKLWAMVLGAVSTMFTKMRGTKSVVTKGKDGFEVNGQAVGGLSGSTLDILAISIRAALIRTFVASCPFWVFDEPFAAADENRAANMLAFIQSCGFPQTLLVTHEDVSQAVADQLIVLEN